MRHFFAACILLLPCLACVDCQADGPADNLPEKVRAVPPPGIAVPPELVVHLNARADAVDKELGRIDGLDPKSQALISVFPRAVRMALTTNMFYQEQQFQLAGELLDEAERRLDEARQGRRGANLLGIVQADPGEPQLLAGGFRSQLDGSIQPYGLVLPQDWPNAKSSPLRLDVWLHGRGENVSEIAFLGQRMQNAGEFAPPGTIVLHPYGRYCNAFKFAGEIDVLEAIQSAQELFEIDDRRVTIRGFSMGGAGCWQLAVHYPDLWAAANPGAGFCETTEFLRLFQQEEFDPTPTQRLLLRWYDCPGWTNNLRNVPTVAYSGELDKQKQAADTMQAAFASRALQLTHVIGPNTGHKIHPDSKLVIQDFLNAALTQEKPQVPDRIDLTTYMLRYHRLGWLSIEGLQEHWQESRAQGSLTEDAIELKTQNITQLRLNFQQGRPFAVGQRVRLKVDADETMLTVPDQLQWEIYCKGNANSWQLNVKSEAAVLYKRPGLQGPIDDAFMSPFVFVSPSGAADTAVEQWAAGEYRHATREWVRHFRGDLLEKHPDEITPQILADYNLILFGTPKSNPLIARVASALPIVWTEKGIQLGAESLEFENYVPLLIYPNPLNPRRYVVINSGVSYREYAYLNNARQIPMLGDWAIVDVSQGPGSQSPGRIVKEGFFDERWQLKAD